MGEHVHEEVELTVDSSSVAAGSNDTDEEKFEALIDALTDKNIDVEIETTTTVENDNE